jgi:polar amino acid transport system substrate-binding protein
VRTNYLSLTTPKPASAKQHRHAARKTIAIACAAGLLITACSSSSKSSSNSSSGAAVSTPAAGGSTSSSAGGVDAAAAALLPADIKSAGVINDGVNLPNPPLEYQNNGAGAYTGFDIDLAAALAAKLGLKVHYDSLAFTALLTSLDSGRVDIVLSGLFDTAKRQAKYNILDYLNTGSQIFTTTANASKAPDLASLCGQTVETAVGTAFSAQLATLSTTLCAGKSPLKVLAVGGSFAEEVLQITTGRAVAAIATSDNIAYSDSTDPGKYVKVGAPFDLTPYGIDIPKADTGLLNALKAALTDILADGTYAKIAAKYGETDGAVTGITVNSGK